tara:strand:- start:329 stop:541 length:213 start_codon:yes stop_codon:yes gene_type:complete
MSKNESEIITNLVARDVELMEALIEIVSNIQQSLISIEEKVARLDSFVLEVSPEEALHATQELEEELNNL